MSHDLSYFSEPRISGAMYSTHKAFMKHYPVKTAVQVITGSSYERTAARHTNVIRSVARCLQVFVGQTHFFGKSKVCQFQHAFWTSFRIEQIFRLQKNETLHMLNIVNSYLK